MSRPFVWFPPASVYTRDRLRTYLPRFGHSDVTVSTKPTTASDEDRPRPYVQVMGMGGDIVRGVRAVDSVRILVNDPDEGYAELLAELCRASLVFYGDATPSGASVRPQLTTDPDTGEPLATVDLDVVMAPSS